MATDKTFTFAGVSTNKEGEVKVRVGCNLMRVKVMAKFGDTNIDYRELPEAMTKSQVCKYLQTLDIYTLPENKEAIDVANEKYNGTAVVKAAKSAVVKTGGKATAKKVVAKKVAVTPAETLANLKKRAAKVTAE